MKIKILFAIEFVLIIAIIALALIGNEEGTGYAVKEIKGAEKPDFKTLTKAVCEEKPEHVFCKDELFVKCSGREVIAKKDDLNDFAECGIKLNLSDAFANGSAEFGKGWTDSREQD